LRECKSVLIALTGASGVIYAERLIQVLAEKKTPRIAGLVYSASALKVYELELGKELHVPSEVKVYSENDFTSPFASSSSLPECMVIVPASMNTIAKIAAGLQDNLITRAASAMLRTRRRLVVVPRETPLGVVELENMLKLARMGAVILPACPGFYHMPKKLGDLVDFMVGKILDSLGVENDLYKRWGQKR